MEKPSKLKNKLLNFLPKAASAFTFRSPTLSPNTIARKGLSIIPAEARRKLRNGSFDVREPTSPKVSCMGQVKNKKKMSKPKRVSLPAEETMPVSRPREIKKNASSSINKTFQGSKPGGKFNVYDDEPPVPESVPSLSQMKKFTSSHGGVLLNFDWRANGTAAVAPDCQNNDLDEEKEEKVIIPHSAFLVGGKLAVEPKKEVELWKRRNKAPPTPLQL